MSNPYGRAHATHRDAWDDGYYAGRLEGAKAGLEAAAMVVDDLDHDLQDDTEGFRTAAILAIRALDPERIAEDK